MHTHTHTLIIFMTLGDPANYVVISLRSKMAATAQEERCVNAFKRGNKQVADKLLPSIRPAVVRTTFVFRFFGHYVAMISLLHLAAYWGWLFV